MYQIDVMSRIPVYEQIVEQTEKFILAFCVQVIRFRLFAVCPSNCL